MSPPTQLVNEPNGNVLSENHELNGKDIAVDESKSAIKEEPPAPRGSVCEIKAVVQKGDETIEKEEYLTSLNKKAFGSYALVVKQVYDEKKLEKTVVEINSPHILSALKKIVSYYPAEPLEFDTQVSYDSPFKLLNHHRKEIEEYVTTEQDEEAKSHLRLLIEFLESEMGDNGPQLERLLKSGLITFDLLWMIFQPGDLIFKEEYGYERLYKLQKTGYQDSCSARGKFFEISVEFTTCDGQRAGISNANIPIWEKEEFVGKSPSKITSLSAVPLKFLGRKEIEPEVLMKSLTERGQRYLAIRGANCFSYEGLFMYLKMPPYDHYDERQEYDGIWLPRSGAGRVVVDCKTFIEEMRRQKEEMSRWTSMFNKGDDKDQAKGRGGPRQTEDVDPMLCPPFLYGYNLSMKQWCKFFVDSLHNFEWTPNAMDSLILPATERKLIQSLVTAHKFPDQSRDESILKGRGLVILLHGEPGTGKTLTAELVAEHCKRPLLKISTGELGAWGDQIADELKEKLEYASIWKAVVLIDEADVFLEQRKRGDARQNNMVALFLKQLEYYQGILFLTSNRVEVFDRAIRSRVHLALQYHSPDEGRRRLMWKQQLVLLDKTDVDLEIEACLDRLAKPEMNGREISNAVNTARTLAASEDSRVQIQHLDMVLKVWEDFSQSLLRIEAASGSRDAQDQPSETDSCCC
ncbi:P-loop containing nucleoside triphosphate hydrolase protein [Pseudovirgaria hyperparasitica]|uniref:P-loop containing nucleoside triphosphate hydrolase protein n=1 Tax=Pseudovirgaria hyperparasitica TaxID=470096 RepID=A0A6A6WJI7_9PEZI|nr:P-loop containing nucleoside triphosphate hydrolase protein [Pseudovirgaria hyperparasitica]KAF2761967.1 P-loop containing nucleoside triphosphate hydrolase protein [Pseudovirgaria hyperparasitica]